MQITQNTAKQNYAGSVASYDIRPVNKMIAPELTRGITSVSIRYCNSVCPSICLSHSWTRNINFCLKQTPYWRDQKISVCSLWWPRPDLQVTWYRACVKQNWDKSGQIKPQRRNILYKVSQKLQNQSTWNFKEMLRLWRLILRCDKTQSLCAN